MLLNVHGMPSKMLRNWKISRYQLVIEISVQQYQYVGTRVRDDNLFNRGARQVFNHLEVIFGWIRKDHKTALC